MTVTVPRGWHHDDVLLAVIEAARIVSNETGYWWELAAVERLDDEDAYWFEPRLWPEQIPFPVPV